MHFQYATLTICNVTATLPTTTPRPVHMAGKSVPITAANTNEEQQLFMLLAAPAPSPPRTTARRNATRGRAPVHFQVCSPYAYLPPKPKPPPNRRVGGIRDVQCHSTLLGVIIYIYIICTHIYNLRGGGGLGGSKLGREIFYAIWFIVLLSFY